MERGSSADRRSVEAADRTVRANRALYDLYARSKPLELRLAVAEAHLAELQRSTSWRLTAPLRWGVERLRALRQRQAKPEEVTAGAGGAGGFLDPVAGYARWVAAGEPPAEPRRAAPLASPTARPDLVVALLLGDAEEGRAASALEHCCADLDTAPDEARGTWRLVALCAPDGPVHRVAAGYAAGRPRLMVLAAAGATGSADLAAAALDGIDAEHLCLLHPDDRPVPGAFGHLCAALEQEPSLDVLFGDEDRLGSDGARTRPFLKPGWDPELLAAGDLLGPLVAFRAGLLRAIGGPQGTDGAAWHNAMGRRAAGASRPDRIRHVARVLCHRGDAGTEDGIADATASCIAKAEPEARAVALPGLPGWSRIVRPVAEPAPLASLVVPTRDKPELLRGCVASILRETAYPRFELVLMDNGTADPEALAVLEELGSDERVRVVPSPGPFNWSALNNAGVTQAHGSVLVLLNNDVAPLRPDWLDEMVAQACRPGVGAVGAKLLYPDGTVQHGGLAMDRDGAPKHLLRGAAADDPGPFGLLALVRTVSAVTGACLAVRRDRFEEVGGLNEVLGVTYNDVEFCLRLGAYGYRNLWTPFALLRHDEMATRGGDDTDEKRGRALREIDRLCRDWGGAAVSDPYLNPNLVLVKEQPCLRTSPA